MVVVLTVVAFAAPVVWFVDVVPIDVRIVVSVDVVPVDVRIVSCSHD